MKYPFNKTPLSEFPFNSRVFENEILGSTAANYVLVAFRPGQALQASELNEIQENYYKDLTLHSILMRNWIGVTGSNFGPSWTGAVPLQTTSCSLDNSTTTTTITVKKDWYLIDDSGFKFWIYNNQELQQSNPEQFTGIIIETEYVTPTEDLNLNDNSGGSIGSAIPGADRYQINITGITTGSTLTAPNIKIFAKNDNGTHKYLNGVNIPTGN
jgi:hypothetical protein